MTLTEQRATHKVRRLTWVALGVSILVSAAMWFWLTGQNTALYQTIIGAGELETSIQILMTLVLLTFTAAALNIFASLRGGIDRRISFVAGLLLVSPLVVTIVLFAWPWY